MIKIAYPAVKVFGGTIFVIATAAYTYGMFIHPLISGSKGWEQLHAVLYSWQTLNSAILALIASAIALFSTIYKDKQEKKRNYLASRAYLTHAYSSTCDYLEELADIYKNIYTSLRTNISFSTLEQPPSIPSLDEGDLMALTNCIKYANDDIGQHLSNILNNLQVIIARTRNYFPARQNYIVTHENMRGELLFLADTYHMIEQSFDFARGSADFEYTPATNTDKIRICRTHFQVFLPER